MEEEFNRVLAENRVSTQYRLTDWAILTRAGFPLSHHLGGYGCVQPSTRRAAF
jgi:hypothetical protein